MFKRSYKFLGAMGVALSLLTASPAGAADYTALALNFDDLSTSTGFGLPLSTYQGFTFDEGTYYINVVNGITGTSSNCLITNNALTIRRSDNKAFYFDSVDHAMRGGETREYFRVLCRRHVVQRNRTQRRRRWKFPQQRRYDRAFRHR